MNKIYTTVKKSIIFMVLYQNILVLIITIMSWSK